jgi:ATP-dependent Clp protease protease subunit
MMEERMDNSLIDRLLKNRIVFLGEINAETSRKIAEQLLQLQFEDDKKPIQVLIDSPGGQSRAAFLLCDLILHVLTVPTHGFVLSKCDSAATFVLLSMPVRRCAPHARFVIHSGKLSNISLRLDTMTSKKMKLLAREIAENTDELAKYYCERLDLSAKKVAELVARGDEDFNDSLSAKEAKKIGLITEIVRGKANLYPRV